MKGICGANTRSGSRCTVSVGHEQELCHLHDPRRAEARKRAASVAGKSRPERELVEIRDLLRNLTDAVLEGRVTTSVGAVATQVLNSRIRLLEVNRRLREQQDVLDRLAELEEKAGLRWNG